VIRDARREAIYDRWECPVCGQAVVMRVRIDAPVCGHTGTRHDARKPAAMVLSEQAHA
jgi:ribosomal protein S27AE